MGITKPRPLEKEDSRADFDCGKPSLNTWFQSYAWRNQATGASRTNIVCDAESGVIVGYVSLASTKIQRAILPKSKQRNMPDPVPAILLGQLAVDKDYQGQGIAASLLLFAFNTVIEVSKQIGCSVLITHPIDDGVREFYKKYGFIDTPFDPDKSMIIKISDLQLARLEIDS